MATPTSSGRWWTASPGSDVGGSIRNREVNSVSGPYGGSDIPTKVRKNMSGIEETEGFSAVERAAIKERAKEVRGSKGRSKKDSETAVLAKIAEMPDTDRLLAERIHALVKDHAPGLTPKTWYGQPAYFNSAGKVVCFFHSAAKYKTRYATLGFEEGAEPGEGTIWPTAFAVTGLTDADLEYLGSLIRRAAG